MHMRGCLCGRLKFAAETGKFDEVADQLVVGVDAEIIDGFGAREAAGEDGVGAAIDDLIGGGVDLIGGSEFEDGVGGAATGVEGEVLTGAGRVFVEVLTGAGGVFVKVLASPGGVFVKVLTSARWIFVKVLASPGWIVDFRKVLSFDEWCR